LSDQVPIFGIEDGVGQSGGSWLQDPIGTAADAIATAPVTALGDDALSYRWINTSATSQAKCRVFRKVDTKLDSMNAAVLNHNLTQRGIVNLVAGRDIFRPALRLGGVGHQAASAAAITAPTTSYTFLMRNFLRAFGPSAANNRLVIFGGGALGATELLFRVQENLDGSFVFQVYNYASLTSLTVAVGDVPRYRWNDWVLRYDISTDLANVWLNGVEAVADTAVAPLAAYGSSCLITFGASGQAVRTGIVAAQLHARYWTDAEVTAWKSEDARATFQDDIICSYSMREGTGSTIADDGPAGATLTMSGGSTWANAVDGRRVEQDGHDSGEVRAWHDPPRVGCSDLVAGNSNTSTPASITERRSMTLDAVIHIPDASLLGQAAGSPRFLSLYKTAWATDSTIILRNYSTYIGVSSYRHSVGAGNLISAAAISSGDSYHIRIVLDGTALEMRCYVDGVLTATLTGVSNFAAAITGSTLQIGHTNAGHISAVQVVHTTLRQGVWESAADLALGWKKRPWWTEGLLAQVGFDGGASTDTGPAAYTMVDAGGIAFTTIDNPDPNKVVLPGASLANAPGGQASSLAAGYTSLIPFYFGSTPVTWDQALVRFWDPLNSDAAIKVGRLFIPGAFRPTKGRSSGGDISFDFPSVGTTRGGAPTISSTSTASEFEVNFPYLTTEEWEEMVARLAMAKAGKSPILLMLRNDLSSPRMAQHCVFGIPVGWSSADFAVGFDAKKVSLIIKRVSA